jgi:hypothetical protein
MREEGSGHRSRRLKTAGRKTETNAGKGRLKGKSVLTGRGTIAPLGKSNQGRISDRKLFVVQELQRQKLPVLVFPQTGEATPEN